VGELVTFLASVNHTGRTSMEVGVKVMAENIRTKVMRHVNSCFFTMVAVGDDRRPVAVPPLQPVTPEQRRRHAAAVARRQLRQELERRYREAAQDATAPHPP
jgi:acyl-CoA hydrolase